MTLLRTHGDYEALARAIRAGDDATAARLSARSGLSRRLLTHRGLGPRGSIPEPVAADALAVLAALSSAGRPEEIAAAALRHRLDHPGVLDLVAGEVEAAGSPGGGTGQAGEPEGQARRRLGRPGGGWAGPAGAHPWAAGLAALDALAAPALRGAALLLRARAAEGAGRTDEARALVGECLAAAPGLLPAVRDAAEYELCAGNWARAWELADSIREDAIAGPMLPALDTLRQPPARAARAGRNQPCPCGSGRKYKVCCLVTDQHAAPHPLAERAVALYAMIASYAQRGPWRMVVDRMLSCAVGAPEAGMLALDLAVFDGGAAQRFLQARGHLLRPDERALLGQWLSVPMDLYEVTWVRPGIAAPAAQHGRRAALGRAARPHAVAVGGPAGPDTGSAAARRNPAPRPRRPGWPAPRLPHPGPWHCSRTGQCRPGRRGLPRAAAGAVLAAAAAAVHHRRQRGIPPVRGRTAGA